MIKDIMLDIIFGIVIGIIISYGYVKYQEKHYDDIDSIMTIKIVNDYINVRKEATRFSKRFTEVLEGEEYEVIEINDNEEKYTWYKIKFSIRRMGWIASDRKDPYVVDVKWMLKKCLKNWGGNNEK